MAETSEQTGISLARVGRSALVLAGAAAVAQAIVIVRELFLAANAGVSDEFDALIIGITLPMTLAAVIRGGAVRALVPAYIAAEKSGGRGDAKLLAGVVLVWVGAGGLIIALALGAFADAIVGVAGPGLTAAQQANSADYLRLLAPVAFVISVSGILVAVLQAEEVFGAIAIGRIAEPVTVLVVMLVLWDGMGIGALAVGSLVGPLVLLAVAILALAQGRLIPTLRLWARGLQLGSFARHSAPITLSLGLLQVNLIIDRAIATLIGPGAVSILRYANTLVRVPIGVIGPAFSQAVYPALVQATHEVDPSGLATATSRTLRYIIAIFVPLAFLTAAVAPVVVSAAYDRGAFTPQELQRTAEVLVALAPLVLLVMVGPILTSALNARRKGMVLLAASVIDIVVHLSLAVILGISIGVIGVALATSLTALVTAAFFARRLARVERDFLLRPLLDLLARSAAAAAPAAIVIGALAWTGMFLPGLVGGLLTLAVYGVAGLAAYVVIAAKVGATEPLSLVLLAVDWISRGRVGGAAT